MSTWLRIDGYPATEIAAHTPPTWETWADGGCGSASWAFSLSMSSQHQAIRVGALVEIMCGLLPIWSGLLSEPDRTTWECTAYGLASAGKTYLALDSGGATTRDLTVAIGQAMTRGWRVLNPAPVSGTAAGDATGNPVSAATLLSNYAEQTGQRWGVDGATRVFMRPDPSSPTWLTAPDSAAFGVSNENTAGRLFGRYLDLATSTYKTASAGSGTEEPVDLTDRGAITQVAAEAILTGMLQRKHSGVSWTNGVTLSRDQIQTRGGTPAFLPAVQAGQMMRSLGFSNAAHSVALDTVIGKTRYTAGEDTIYVEPVNTVPHDVRGVIAAS